MNDVPSKALFCYLPEKSGENSRFKSWFEMNLSAGDDFVNQKGHTESEKERDKIFQDKSDDGFHVQEGANRVILKKGNRGRKGHAHD